MINYCYFINIKKSCITFIFFITLLFFTSTSTADSFKYNFYNNHGVVGLINMPTARFFNESVHGITAYDGYPPQKITLSSNPFDWLEASFFYTNIQDKPYPGYEFQDYKDKGFNLKLRIREEDNLPAIAIGINDIAGTGYFSSEYIVGSYGISNLDLHFGLGWGNYNGANQKLKNPLKYLSKKFENRPKDFEGYGGSFNADRYFSGKDISPFYGASYALNSKILLKIEKDTTLIDGLIDYDIPKSKFSLGMDYAINDNFSLGISFERGNFFSFKFIYKNNPKQIKRNYEYKSAEASPEDSKYTKLIKNLEENGIGVNRITEAADSIGLELTQFIHPNLNQIEKIVNQASIDAGFKNKKIKKDYKVANLTAASEIDKNLRYDSKLVYERKKTSSFNSSTRLRFRPFLASREEFFKGALFIENDSEAIITDNLFFNTNLKYSIYNNFDDFRYEPVKAYPAQVRSDVKKYLKNVDDKILIGRAQLDYHITPKPNNHFMLTAGILEDMYSGYGLEYLYFKHMQNYAIGFELFNVRKRDYSWGFGHTDYQNTIASANFYYRNYGTVPFDMKFSFGEYLAGDIGSTIEFSRSFENGTKFGVFASFTDVSEEQFGEGSFDKGIFFNIPIYGNFINYTWRPLTKDPGAKLNRRNNLYDLLVKFQPIN